MSPRKSEFLSSQDGLTLVEVLIASLIMGLVITVMVAVISNVSRLDTGADQYRQARNFLKEEIEDPNRHYSRYADITGYPSYPGLHLDANPGIGYLGIPAFASVVVSETPTTVTIYGVPVSYYHVQASMTWTDRDETTRSLALNKLVTNAKDAE